MYNLSNENVRVFLSPFSICRTLMSLMSEQWRVKAREDVLSESHCSQLVFTDLLIMLLMWERTDRTDWDSRRAVVVLYSGQIREQIEQNGIHICDQFRFNYKPSPRHWFCRPHMWITSYGLSVYGFIKIKSLLTVI